MRRLLIISAALALTACASTPPPTLVPAAGSAHAGISGHATLARWGGWEMQLAPAYTRLAGLRHRAAAQLDARRIPVATAIAVQTTADQARTALDRARRNDAADPTPEQRAALADAMALIERVQTLLEQPQ